MTILSVLSTASVSISSIDLYFPSSLGSHGVVCDGQGATATLTLDQVVVRVAGGNGTVGTPSNRSDTTNRGESFLKLTRNGTNLTVASWFTPYNFTNLENGDVDLGSAGVMHRTSVFYPAEALKRVGPRLR